MLVLHTLTVAVILYILYVYTFIIALYFILGWINEKIIAFRDASSEILKSMRIIGDIDDSRACKEVPVEVAELCDFNYHDIDETKKQFDDYIDKFITADKQEPQK